MLLPADEPGRVNLAAKAREFIRDAEQRGANVAADVNRLVTAEFLRTVKKSYADEIRRNDLFDFHAALRKRGCSDRTVANKHARIASFLRFSGVDRSILPPPPRYDETLPTIYTSDEISCILGAAGPYMHLVISLALKCGLRDQEIMHLEWADILDADSASLPARIRLVFSAGDHAGDCGSTHHLEDQAASQTGTGYG